MNPDSWSVSTKSTVAPFQVLGAGRIDDHRTPWNSNSGRRPGAAVEAERVLEAAAAAALDRDPKHLGLARRLLRHQAATLSAARSVSVTSGGLLLVSIVAMPKVYPRALRLGTS